MISFLLYITVSSYITLDTEVVYFLAMFFPYIKRPFLIRKASVIYIFSF